MPHNRTNDTVQFSVKLPNGLRERVDELASQRRWSRSQTAVYLLEEGDVAGDDVTADPEMGESGAETVVSVYTDRIGVVDAVQDVADEHFGGTFSKAARATMRDGLGG